MLQPHERSNSPDGPSPVGQSPAGDSRADGSHHRPADQIAHTSPARPAAVDRLTQLLALIEREPNDTFCLYGVAQEYAKRGAWNEAIHFYDRCLATNADYCYAYFHKGKALESAGRVDEAITTLRLGVTRARALRDAQATSELSAYLDELT